MGVQSPGIKRGQTSESKIRNQWNTNISNTLLPEHVAIQTTQDRTKEDTQEVMRGEEPGDYYTDSF